MNFYFKVAAFLLVSQLGVMGQTKLSSSQNGQPYSLRECVDYALKNNPNILLNELSVENAMVQLNQSKMNKLPIANGQFNINGNAGRNVDPFTNGIVTSTIGTNNMGVGASVPIYDAFRNKNTIERNKLNIEAAQMDVNAIKNSVALQVAIAYLNVLSTEDLIEVSLKQLEVTRLQIERTQKLVNAGTLAETNLFDLEAQEANDELALVNAQNNHESALLTLKQAMNAPLDLDIKPTRISIADPNIEQYAATAMQVYDTAIGYLPEIKAGEIRLRASDRNIAIARSVGLPSLSATTSWGTAFSSVAKRVVSTTTNNTPLPVSAEFQGQTIPFVINFPQTQVVTESIPYFRQLGNNQNLNVGLALRIPIFNGYNQKYQTQLAQIQKKQTELQNQNAKLQVKQNIDQAYITMLNAKKRYTATMLQVTALEKSFKAVESRYSAGSGNFVDYNLAKTNLDRARTNLIVAKYDYVFRMKVLDFYQNKPLEL